jgi:tight adherence protein B
VRRGRVLAILGALLLVLTLALPAAAEEQSVQIGRVDTDAFPTVDVTVLVDGKLDPGSVQVTENGSPVRVLSVRPFTAVVDRIDVVLVIDTSRSVQGKPLASAVDAAKRFVDSLSSKVWVGVLTFDRDTRVLVDITRDRGAVVAALDGLSQTLLGTHLYDGVTAASRMFSGPQPYNIVLFTDGADVGSRSSLEDAVAAARKVRAAVFAVGLRSGTIDFAALESLASSTGGTFTPVSAADLSKLYESLAKRISNQYRILYQSRGTAGAQVTVGVQTPLGSDSSSVLLPRHFLPVAEPKPGKPLLYGNWGLAVVLGLIFLAMFLIGGVVMGATYQSRRDRMLARRMAAPPASQDGSVGRPGEGPTAWIPEPIVQAGQTIAEVGGFRASLDRKLERAGLPMTSGEIVASSFILGFLGMLLIGLIFQNILIALVAAVVIGAIPFVLVNRKLKRRLEALSAQLPDVLMILASSMRAGHSFLQALDTVAKEIGEPGGPEFARVVAEIRLGRRFEDSLGALAERVGTDEFKWAVMAVNVQRDVGGNLAEILDTLAETVRDRETVRRQVKVLSAEGRLSVKILIAMPFVIAAFLTLTNRDYMRLLWTTRMGWFFMVTGGVLMIVGAIWSSRTVKIDV